MLEKKRPPDQSYGEDIIVVAAKEINWQTADSKDVEEKDESAVSFLLEEPCASLKVKEWSSARAYQRLFQGNRSARIVTAGSSL